MTRKQVLLLLVAGLAAVVATAALGHRGPSDLVLTGIVAANDVIISPQVGGRLSRLLVSEGARVAPHQLLAVLEPDELRADRTFYARSAEATTSQLAASEAELAVSQAQQREAHASLASAKELLDRNEALFLSGGLSQQDLDAARTAYAVAEARAAAADGEVASRQSVVAASRERARAATAQTAKADVRLAYSEITAPSAGIVDVRAARVGEVVTAGQPIVTLVDPDSFWVRADVEETYIDRVRLGDRLTVRLPSGATRGGTVFYRSVDADFATQRDVSRTKRDLKTFEIRLRVDNRDGALALGMTAYVLLPLGHS